MKLIAEKWICDQSPKGARLDVPEADARILIAAGLARVDDSNYQTSAVTATTSTSDPVHGRHYRRRDMKAEK